jgi:replicative DNA helicase
MNPHHARHTRPLRFILDAILMDNSAYSQPANLAPKDFFVDARRRMYMRMRHLAEFCRPLDMITLRDELGHRNELDVVGNGSCILGLTDGAPSRPSIVRYVRIVQYEARRRFLKSAEDVQRLAFDPTVIPLSRLASHFPKGVEL